MKNILLVLLFCFLGFLTSCDDWLEVESKKEISAELLFTEGVGFRNALNGIFQECGKPSLYGKSLTWGALSAVSQTYDKVTVEDEIFYFKDFKYNEQASMISTYSAWWDGMYKIIANINAMLAHIEDADPSLFAEGEKEKNLIKGEALAMRAFLHLDIVRLFAPAPSKNKDFKMIPYQDVFPLKVTMPKTTDELLARVADDLLAAKELVVQWDTIDGINQLMPGSPHRRYASGNTPKAGTFFQYRLMRMNYPAIIGMLVRTYMYKGDYANAWYYAKHFYNTFMPNGTTLIKDSDGEGMALYPYQPSSHYAESKKVLDEVLFALYYPDLLENVENYYRQAKEEEKEGLSLARIDAMYEGEEDDYRKVNLIENYGGDDITLWKSLKYREIGSDPNSEGGIIPILRMAEVVYALIECEYRLGDKNQALTYFNELRDKKGIKGVTYTMDDISSLDRLMDLLVKDMERETIGEGQMFYMHKRLNRDFTSPKGEIITITDEKVVFEIPESQYTN